MLYNVTIMDKTAVSMVIYVWILLAVGCHVTYGQTCTNGQVINDICYTIVRLRKTYAESSSYCTENGGHLASITDQETQNGIDNFAQANLYTIDELWIGASETEGTQADRVWKWISDDSTISNQGCYRDLSEDRDLPKSIDMTSSTFSVQKCLDRCAHESYKYAGIQNGDQCFCGDSFGSLGNATGCTVGCPTTQNPSIPYCGGVFRNTIIDLGGSYTRWGFDQPNNHERYQRCAVLDMTLETKTADEYCHKRYRYICDLPNKSSGTCSGGETGTVNGIYYPGSATDMCYLVSTDAVSNWYVANYNCKQLNGRLSVVNTEQIHTELKTLINDVITAASLVTSNKLWIGLRRGGWTWDTEEPFLYTNWKMNEPNSWEANCVILTRSNNFMWEDRDCATPAYFVCQEGDIPVPATTTTTTTTVVTTTTTPPKTQTPTAAQQTSDSSLTTDEIILLVIVLVLFVVGVIIFTVIIYYCCTRKSRRVDYSNKSSVSSDRRVITGPQSHRSMGSVQSNEFIDINDQTDYYNGSAISYRY